MKIDEKDPKLVEVVAKAIWEERRKREIEELAAITFDASVFERAAQLMLGASSREVTILGWALISHCLDFAVRQHLSHSTAKELSEFCDGLGPLASDAAKLKMARLLGWLPGVTSSGVEAIRRARNRVAHEIVECDDVSALNSVPDISREHLGAALDRIRKIVASGAGVDLEHVEISDGPRFKCYVLFLASDVLTDILCGPGKLRLGIGKPGGFFGFDEGPEWSRNVARACAGAIIAVLREAFGADVLGADN